MGLCEPGPGTLVALLTGRCFEVDLKALLCIFDILLDADFEYLPNVEAGRYEPGPGVPSPRISIRISRFVFARNPGFWPGVFGVGLRLAWPGEPGLAFAPVEAIDLNGPK